MDPAVSVTDPADTSTMDPAVSVTDPAVSVASSAARPWHLPQAAGGGARAPHHGLDGEVGARGRGDLQWLLRRLASTMATVIVLWPHSSTVEAMAEPCWCWI